MDLINFDNNKRDIGRQYSGSDRKIALIYHDRPIMLKFANKHARVNDIDTSSVNNVISEYIGSHIFKTCNIDVQETVLGTYEDTLVVGCYNFLADKNDSLIEFDKFLREHYYSNDIGRRPDYNQLYVVFDNNPVLRDIKETALKRYWDTFVIDALIGNFDRHKNNWGYIYNSKNESLTCAPVYDNGSTLFPSLSDEGMKMILDDENEILKRVYDFPKACLEINGHKIHYYDMLASGFDDNATAALKRMINRINLTEINNEINATPLISDTRKEFYKTIIRNRYERILVRAYEKVELKEFDKQSISRISSLIQADRGIVKDYEYFYNAGGSFINDNSRQLVFMNERY